MGRSVGRCLGHIRRLGALGILLGVTLDGGLSATANASCPNTAVRVGNSEALPDCRAYEQVSPIKKDGYSAYPPTAPQVQLSSSGEAIEYLSFAGFPGASASVGVSSAHVSSRTADGWVTADWAPKLPEVVRTYKVAYRFSEDLSQAVFQVPYVALAPGATPNAYNLFVGDGAGSYSLINAALPARSVAELCPPSQLLEICNTFLDHQVYAGASRDFHNVMFESNGQLTPEAPSTPSLYESAAGTVRLVGILPDGTPAASSTAGAEVSIFEFFSSIERSISRDGSHVIFQAPSDGGVPLEQNGPTEVYDRINGTETVEISAPAAEANPAVPTPEPATFHTASVDGLRVFFTSSAELTAPSNTGEANNSEDLYEYSLATHQVTDLTVDTNPEDATTGAMVQGVVGSSSDGSYVYFVADGLLAEGKGVDGQPNLYMVHNGGKPVFIATLESRGSCEPENGVSDDSCDWSPRPSKLESYVTPDGAHMAFMSINRLSTTNLPDGYDNIDQETGEADNEVYEFSAPTKAGGTGQLICASCDPSGARPIGPAAIGGMAATGTTPQGRIQLASIGTPFVRVRALSDDGHRAFYSAAPSLATPALSRVNPYESVYEYERDGDGSCERVGGCQNLLSDPTISEGEFFLGASASGDDVYLAASSRLASTDFDELKDIYDARVDGGFAPPPVESQCESKCPQASQTPTDQPVATGVVGPAGNLPAPRPTSKPTPKKTCRKGFRLIHNKCLKVKHGKNRKVGTKRSPKYTSKKGSR
jgi:hypothetical protein